jgi:hypothetical protein
MLDIHIVIEEISTFTGSITLFFNQGGVRGAKAGDRSLKYCRPDSIRPQMLFDRPTST